MISSFFFAGAGSLLKRLSSSRSELADLFSPGFAVDVAEPPHGSEVVLALAAEVAGEGRSSNRDSILSICCIPCNIRIFILSRTISMS
jgi:hypothetical protein